VAVTVYFPQTASKEGREQGEGGLGYVRGGRSPGVNQPTAVVYPKNNSVNRK